MSQQTEKEALKPKTKEAFAKMLMDEYGYDEKLARLCAADVAGYGAFDSQQPIEGVKADVVDRMSAASGMIDQAFRNLEDERFMNQRTAANISMMRGLHKQIKEGIAALSALPQPSERDVVKPEIPNWEELTDTYATSFVNSLNLPYGDKDSKGNTEIRDSLKVYIAAHDLFKRFVMLGISIAEEKVQQPSAPAGALTDFEQKITAWKEYGEARREKGHRGLASLEVTEAFYFGWHAAMAKKAGA